MEVEKVPLAYGPKNKFLYRLQGNPTDGPKIAITLPRIYFEMTGIDYDPSRKTPATQRIKAVIPDAGVEANATEVAPLEILVSVLIRLLA